MVRLKNPNLNHHVIGFGDVNVSNINEDLYLRLIEHEPNLAELFELDEDIGEESDDELG
jgi:hypothetical protein